MKTTTLKSCAILLLAGNLFLAASQWANAQLTFTTNNGALTVTGWGVSTVGNPATVVIPDTTNGMPVVAIADYAFAPGVFSDVTIGNNVTTIGNWAFWDCSLAHVTIGNRVTNIGDGAFDNDNLSSVTIPNGVTRIGSYAFADNSLYPSSVTIPDSVTSIGDYAFWDSYMTNVTIGTGVTSIGAGAFADCAPLKAIQVDPLNAHYSSLDGVLFDKTQTRLIQWPGGRSGRYTIPNRVTSIGRQAFWNTYALTNVTIPSSVTNIGYGAFAWCLQLQAAFFLGDAPAPGDPVSFNDCANVCYYLPGKSGWGATYAGLPACLWNPAAQTAGPGFGVHSNRFGFNITGTANIPIVVEATTNLSGGSWMPLQTCTLTNGSLYFSDPAWTSYRSRLYRIRAP